MHFLRPVLGIMATCVMTLCSQLLPPGGGFSIYKTVHRIWLRILSIALEKEVRFLEYASLLHYYYLVSFDCSMFLHFLTSLIKLIFWLKFFFPQTKGRPRTWQGGKDCSHALFQVEIKSGKGCLELE